MVLRRNGLQCSGLSLYGVTRVMLSSAMRRYRVVESCNAKVAKRVVPQRSGFAESCSVMARVAT